MTDLKATARTAILALALLFTAGLSLFAQEKPFPNQADAEKLVEHAAGMIANRQYDEAVRLADKALKMDADNDAAHYYKGIALVMTDNS